MPSQLAIYPAIGIARVGASQETYIGPELPGASITDSVGKFHDANGKRRREAARFRVFATGASGTVATEVTIGSMVDGKTVQAIEWTSHLANKKAFWFQFLGLAGEGVAAYPSGHPFRNGTAAMQLDERHKKYAIDFGPRTVAGANQSAKFSKGTGGGFPETFPGPLHNGATPVEITELGELRTDGGGRLIVVGGFGISGKRGSIPGGGLHYANNPEWFDDVADGPIQARLLFTDQSAANVPGGAWVIIGPPDYAPDLENLVTLWDLLYDLAVREFDFAPAIFNRASGQFLTNYEPSYTRDIYPIIRRAGDYRWVIASGGNMHLWNYTALSKKPYVPTPGQKSPAQILSFIRNPEDWANPFDADLKMPQLYGDTGEADSSLTLTRTQYHILSQWRKGVFQADWNGPAPADTIITPDGLNRAALDHCVGGAFFPGIEAGWILRDPRIFARPFRLKTPIADEFNLMGLTPGSVTMRSALPWQADFLKCGTHWWPAARPNQVHVDEAGTIDEWDRTITGHLPMVREWHLLKTVVPTMNTAGQPIFAEEQP